MTRYYFDTRDGDLVRDEVGIECDSYQAVLAHATSGLSDLAKDIVPGAKSREMAVRVRDGQGRPVMEAVLRLEIREDGDMSDEDHPPPSS